MSDVTYYKVLNEDRTSTFEGYRWPYRRWTEPVPNPELCVQGWHACTLEQLPAWLGPRIWEVELRGVVHGPDKVVAQSARLVRLTPWDDRRARLFAADCAEHVLDVFESACPGDSRPREAIAAARRFADGELTYAQMSATRAAAFDAAKAAAYASAEAAAYAAADAVAGSAAYATAESSAIAAAYAGSDYAVADIAAYDAERSWQAGRLGYYLEATND